MVNEGKKDPVSEVKIRLIEFIEYLHVSKNAFQKSINASAGFVQNISKGLGEEKVREISMLYPELNIDWLKNGNGDMLTDALGSRPLRPSMARVYDVLKWSKLTIEEFVSAINASFYLYPHGSGSRRSNMGSIMFRYALNNRISTREEDIEEWLYRPILSCWPQISKEWLYFGRGKMTDDSPEPSQEDGMKNEIIGELWKFKDKIELLTLALQGRDLKLSIVRKHIEELLQSKTLDECKDMIRELLCDEYLFKLETVEV